MSVTGSAEINIRPFSQWKEAARWGATVGIAGDGSGGLYQASIYMPCPLPWPGKNWMSFDSLEITTNGNLVNPVYYVLFDPTERVGATTQMQMRRGGTLTTWGAAQALRSTNDPTLFSGRFHSMDDPTLHTRATVAMLAIEVYPNTNGVSVTMACSGILCTEAYLDARFGGPPIMGMK